MGIQNTRRVPVMITKLRCALVMMLMLGCASGGVARADEKTRGADIARAASKRQAKSRERVLVSGSALTHEPLQCGGVRVREDQPMFRASPLSQRFLVRRGGVNSEAAVVASVSARAGKFSVYLPGPGRYCLIHEHQRSRPRPPAPGGLSAPVPGADRECLRALWERCVATWEVGPQGLADTRIDVYQRCSCVGHPCDRHRKPPS